MADGNKILTISVAAYNVSETIEQCLESCLASEVRDDIEILVIDDGSTDNTSDLVRQYEAEYPGIVRLVSKQNGGYGSTVNTSIELASGRYYRLLDGDDWVDSAGLSSLVKDLRSSDADMAISPYVICGSDGMQLDDQADPVAEGEVPFAGSLVPGHLNMHSICYRTELIKESGLRLPEHRLYTDTLFNVVPLQLVKTALVAHTPVYYYRVGRLGQSVSRESVESHYEDLCAVVHDLLNLYESLCDKDSLAAQVLLRWLVGDASWAIHILCGMKPNGDVTRALTRLIDAIRKNQTVCRACSAKTRLSGALLKAPAFMRPLIMGVYRISNR